MNVYEVGIRVLTLENQSKYRLLVNDLLLLICLSSLLFGVACPIFMTSDKSFFSIFQDSEVTICLYVKLNVESQPSKL